MEYELFNDRNIQEMRTMKLDKEFGTLLLAANLHI